MAQEPGEPLGGQALWRMIFKCILKEYSSCVGDAFPQDTDSETVPSRNECQAASGL